jgi:hypothetical protein
MLHQFNRKALPMKNFVRALAIAAALFSPAAAISADLPTKASVAASSFFNPYPYGSSGFFVGIFTEGGSGSVNGSVAGANTASLTSTQAGAGLTIGYAWGKAGSPIAISVEGDFGWTNFNGSQSGLSLSGPASFEQRFVIFTPLASMLNMLPLLNSALGTVPPFPTLTAGLTASNLQVGLMAGIDENDISVNFPGLASNTEWAIAPMIGLVAMEQLSNGTAVRSWIKNVFAERSVCAGPVANACASRGDTVKVGIGIYY